MKKLNIIIFVLIFCVLTAFGLFLSNKFSNKKSSKTVTPLSNTNVVQSSNSSNNNFNAYDGSISADPISTKLDVPFIVQSPLGVWDALHEDSCEEATLLMYNYFRNNLQSSTPENYDAEIKELDSYEANNGYDPSITLEQLAALAQTRFDNLTSPRIESDITVQQIKNELIKGNPVIIPAYGKALNNPNFKNGGPNYHMLLIIGYNSDGFITNDPGTKNGKDYLYPFDTIINGDHNWNSQNMLDGKKEYLVFDK